MSATGKDAAREAGHTLTELLVALAILTLLAGISAPSIGRLLTRQAMVETEGAISLGVAQAHADAVAHAITVQLALTSDGGRLISSAGRIGRAWPVGVTLDWPRRGIAFHGDGTATDWDGAIHDGAATRHFHIDPQRGRAVFRT